MLFLGAFATQAQNSIAETRTAVETYPDSLALHQEFIKVSGLSEPELGQQYEQWMKKFPKSATVQFALGEAYWKKELPSAKPLLLKAVELNPKLSQAYFYLWIDGDRWGEFEKSREYLLKAKEVAPNNPDYAYYYASTFGNSDFEKYCELSMEVAKKFPESERGAQSLYWLAERSTEKADKIKYLELLKSSFPPEKFGWSSSGMMSYYSVLLDDDTEKAIALAQYSLSIEKDDYAKKMWGGSVKESQNILKAKTLFAQNKPAKALAVLDDMILDRYSPAKELVAILKAEALDKLGKTDVAYSNLKVMYAQSPESKIKVALHNYGKKLKKSPNDIEKDVFAIRDTLSKPATNFDLKQYFQEGNKSLSDYTGKVVLITYWFPGCGPCRGEFPHFQAVVDKFKGQDLVYLGINISPEQNDYVIPFMKSSGYSFIPLEDYKDRVKGNLDNHGAAPANFLIDRKGNVVFSKFRTDEHNKDVLEQMISSLLKK